MKKHLILVCLLTLHLIVLSQLRFTAWPEMLSYPYLISKGFDLYRDIAMPYQPLLPLFQSIYFSIFGFDLFVLKVLTWGIVIICDLLIFLISRKILGEKIIALLPLSIYIILQPLMDGNGLWFDLSLTPFILLAIYSFLFFRGSRKFFFVSLFLMIASLIKQQTAIIFMFLTPQIVFSLWKSRKMINLAWYFLGGVTPILLVVFYILIKGTWSDYFFWTFWVPFYWYPQYSSYLNFPTRLDLIRLLLIFSPLMIVLTNTKKLRNDFLPLLVMFLLLLVTSFTRFEYLRLQQALAVYVILLIFIIRDYKRYLPLVLASIIFGALSLLSINLGNVGQNRFYEDKDSKLATQIKKIASNETVYLINLPSIIYPMVDLLPPKPWIDNYVWYFESDGLQKKFITGLSSNPPKYVFRKKPESGHWDALGVYEPKQVLSYIKDHYHQEGIIGDNIEIWVKN